MRDVNLEDTIYPKFTTRAFATGIPTTLSGTPVLSIYEENNLTQITTGVSITADYDTVTGLNQATIVATAANGYEAGKSYDLIITTGTVGGVSVVGEIVFSFTVEDSAAVSALVTAQTDLDTITGSDGVTLATAQALYAPAIAGDAMTLTAAATSAQLVDDVWDELITSGQHNATNSAGRYQRLAADIVLVDSAVDDVSATTTSFNTDLTEVDNHWNDSVLVFTSGTLTGQARAITDYAQINGTITFDEALTSAPNNNVSFSVVSTHVHPITQIQAGLATEAKQDIMDTNVDSILVDTGTTIPNVLGTPSADVSADIAAINALIGAPAGADVSTDIAAIKVDTASGGIPRNATFNDFEFPMVLTSDHYTAATGATVTCERSIDGSSFASATGTVAEIGSGVYQIDLTAADTNGDTITYKFSATSCDDTIITVTTRS